MAHGNTSDLVFLLLFIGAILAWTKPDVLFQTTFPLADEGVGALITFSGGLAFLLGMMFSGIKWNPINGKMGGFGAFCAGANATSLGRSTGHIFFYVFAAPLILGAVHIFAFPSNPPVAKTPENKNNHGNASDLVMLSLFIGSMACIFYPSFYFEDIGPIKASFMPNDPHNLQLEVLISNCGGLLFAIAMIFSGVKWNPINGKMAGIGCFVSAALGVYVGSGTFFIFYAAVLLFGGVHIFVFPSNPLPAKAAPP